MNDTRTQLEALLVERILVLDGSWGVLIHRRGFSEEEYRGERFRDHSHDVKGDPDLLNLTRPEVVAEIHDAYFDAGADIATTNTFTATRIGQADYALLQSDVAWLAASGAGPFALDGPLKRIAALASLYPEPVHIVVSAKSGIRRVEDLRGKRVDLGTPRSGTRINAVSVLQASGVAPKEFAEARAEGPQAAAQQLRAG